MSDDRNIVNELSDERLPPEASACESRVFSRGGIAEWAAGCERDCRHPHRRSRRRRAFRRQRKPPPDVPAAEAPQPAPIAEAPIAECLSRTAVEPSAGQPPAEAKPAEPEKQPQAEIDAENKEPEKETEKKEEPKSDKMEWYILKVQSNREDSIREGLLRRVAIAGRTDSSET